LHTYGLVTFLCNLSAATFQFSIRHNASHHHILLFRNETSKHFFYVGYRTRQKVSCDLLQYSVSRKPDRHD